MYTYRTLKLEIPWRLVEERPDVLGLAMRVLAAEEYVRRLLKELTGQEELKLTAPHTYFQQMRVSCQDNRRGVRQIRPWEEPCELC
ncbi:hypothetical protein Pisl_1730 [Pyrobaculum islandicum DSM 4184]|uniref:Uncharacterized protein n=1 Tax=Pyrobaculum islandicum (strain DSM 4184 / JCM 9189 / GEO3) TaxID=384616 RepID=A1RV99_PYRIL|nr:hypothetical protein Pisl_1730 [Pyrobaculum islandicum DSM 4184]